MLGHDLRFKHNAPETNVNGNWVAAQFGSLAQLPNWERGRSARNEREARK